MQIMVKEVDMTGIEVYDLFQCHKVTIKGHTESTGKGLGKG